MSSVIELQLIINHSKVKINPLNAELNPICHLLALLGGHHILHVSRIRVNLNYILRFRAYRAVNKLCLF